MRTIFGRLASALLVLLCLSAFTFLLAELAPGDAFSGASLDPRVDPEHLEELRRRHGLDRPLAERYGAWLGAALKGDLGHSFLRGTAVAPLVGRRLAASLILVLPAWLAAWALALAIGPWLAAPGPSRGGRLIAATVEKAGLLLLALPQVVLALLALFLAARTGLFPVGGMSSLGAESLAWPARGWDLFHHWVLPAAALVLHALPVLLVHVRSAVADAFEAPFVLAARAQGASRLRLLWGRALPAAAGSLVPLAGLSFAGTVSAAALVEVVLGWPGLGSLVLESVLARDLPLAVAAVLTAGALLLLANGAADLLLHALDPRTRRQPREAVP